MRLTGEPTRRLRILRRTATFAIVTIAAGVVAAVAQAHLCYKQVQYGPSLWNPGTSAHTWYDDAGSYPNDYSAWFANTLVKDAPDGAAYGRVTFIDGGGGWHYTVRDNNGTTATGIQDGYEYFTKKAFAQNDDPYSGYWGGAFASYWGDRPEACTGI